MRGVPILAGLGLALMLLWFEYQFLEIFFLLLCLLFLFYLFFFGYDLKNGKLQLFVYSISLIRGRFRCPKANPREW